MLSETRSHWYYRHRLLYVLPALLACLFFLLAGLAMLTKIGIENDETIFTGSFLKPYGNAYTVRIGHSRVPLMVMTYIGTLKAWLYRPLIKIFGTGLALLRIPMLLAGAASVWLLFRLLFRMAGLRAALVGCAILATDSTYLLTATFDWGPVALQHLLLIAGLLLLLRHYQVGRYPALFWGFFLLGLGMWDKALAVWLLSGMAVGAVVVMPKRLLLLATRKRMLLATLGFVLGVFPLLIYNVNNQWATFAGNITRDTSDIPGKARLLMETAKGDGLFGWMFDEQWQTPAPHPPSGIIQTASAKISSIFGHPRRHAVFYLFVAALLLTPLARGEALRAILFSLIAMAVAWVQMATNANTGGSIHHTILLWPFPIVVIAVSFAAASRRLGRAGIPALALVTVAAATSGALVANEYYYVSYTFGASPGWSDAIIPLAGYTKDMRAGNVYCVDWGMLDPLRYLDGGKLALQSVDRAPLLKPAMTPEDRESVLHIVTDPDAVFIAHTKDFENFAGMNAGLLKFAAAEGYRPDILTTISDTFGRRVFEVYRFVPVASSGQ